MQDLSSDIFAAFKEMAVATGGLTESTSNPDFALRQATEASRQLLSLCITGRSRTGRTGASAKIEVRVRGEGLKVVHRLGYIAD